MTMFQVSGFRRSSETGGKPKTVTLTRPSQAPAPPPPPPPPPPAPKPVAVPVQAPKIAVQPEQAPSPVTPVVDPNPVQPVPPPSPVPPIVDPNPTAPISAEAVQANLTPTGSGSTTPGPLDLEEIPKKSESSVSVQPESADPAPQTEIPEPEIKTLQPADLHKIYIPGWEVILVTEGTPTGRTDVMGAVLVLQRTVS